MKRGGGEQLNVVRYEPWAFISGGQVRSTQAGSAAGLLMCLSGCYQVLDRGSRLCPDVLGQVPRGGAKTKS
jgi:hypothetical protein